MAGVNRWKDASNSLATFNQASRGSKKWIDPSFDASQTSWTWTSWDRKGWTARSQYKRYINAWKRPSEILFGKSPKLYGNLGKPLPYGTKQGAIGDCWFLAAAASLAEHPAMVSRLIANKKYS